MGRMIGRAPFAYGIDNASPLFEAWEGPTRVRPAGKAAEWDGPQALPPGPFSADPGLLQVLLVLGGGIIIITPGVEAEVKISHI